MTDILLLLLGLILFSLLIVLHEYGHFLVAKRNGVKVEEFGLGFPPKLVGRELGRGIFRGYYSLNLLPIGGFVRLKGENDSAKGAGTYGSRSLWVKTKIILAGVAVNFLIAFFLFTLLALIGIPKLLPAEPRFSDEQFSLASDTHLVGQKTLVSYIEKDSPAEKAGLELGDALLTLTDTKSSQVYAVEDSDGFYELTIHLAGRRVELEIIRDRQPQSLTAELRTLAEAEAADSGRLGASTSDFILQRNTWSAPLTGLVLTGQFTKVTLQGLGQALWSLVTGDTERAKESVTGPIGIFFVLKGGAGQGLQVILMVIALISLTLAIVNSLPIPALDGGRLALTLLFRKVLRRPLTKRIENRVVGTSFVVLMALMVLVVFVDIDRFFLSG